MNFTETTQTTYEPSLNMFRRELVKDLTIELLRVPDTEYALDKMVALAIDMSNQIIEELKKRESEDE